MKGEVLRVCVGYIYGECGLFEVDCIGSVCRSTRAVVVDNQVVHHQINAPSQTRSIVCTMVEH